MDSKTFGGAKNQGQATERQQEDPFNPRSRQDQPFFPKGKQDSSSYSTQKGKQEDLFAQQQQLKGKQEDLFAQQQTGNFEDLSGQKGKQKDPFWQQRERQDDIFKNENRKTDTTVTAGDTFGGPTKRAAATAAAASDSQRTERTENYAFGDFSAGGAREPPVTSRPHYAHVAGDVELSATPGYDVIHNPAMQTMVKMVTMLNFMKVELGEAKTLRSKEQWRAAGAEFVGTFLFVFLGCGSVVASGMLFADMTPSRLIAIALAHGMAICCLAGATGAISGGHLNPAVTLAFVVAGKENLVRAGLYANAQILGGIFGALFLQFSTPEYLRGNLGSHDISMYIYTSQGFLMEMVLTFALVIVIFGVAVDRRGPGVIAPIPIGFVVSVDHLVGVPYTGASMNPARSFGPALVSGYFGSAHLVYWVAPCLGATAAAALYRYAILQPAATAVSTPAAIAPR